MIRIIRSGTGWYHYICRTRTQANSLIFLFWLVLLSLTLSIDGAMLALCPVQVNSHLGVSLDSLSSRAHLFKETKPKFCVDTQHPRFPPSFQPLRKGGKKLGGEETRPKSWGTGQPGDLPQISKWALATSGLGVSLPSYLWWPCCFLIFL